MLLQSSCVSLNSGSGLISFLGATNYLQIKLSLSALRLGCVLLFHLEFGENSICVSFSVEGSFF